FGADEAIESQVGKPQRASAVVWADGHGAARIPDVQLYGADPPVIEVKLERGSIDVLSGRITRRGADVAGARASLRPYAMASWQSDADHLGARADPDERGGFALRAPAGEYLFEVVREGRTELQRPLTLPQRAPLQIDLADEIRVTVDVVDAHGQPAANHN